MKFTGERMIPEENKGTLIYLEHFSRYLFAAQLVRDKVVLDIACGSGYGAQYLADRGAKKVLGIDQASEAITYAQQHYHRENVAYLVGDARQIPTEAHCFDVVVSFETIEHFEEHQTFLKEIQRVLKPDGIFIISTPNRLVYDAGREFHKKELSLEEFKKLLEDYFSFSQIFYQRNVVANYILSAKHLKEDTIRPIENSRCYQFSDQRPEEHVFAIGLASQSNIIAGLHEVVALYSEDIIAGLQRAAEVWQQAALQSDQELKKIVRSPSFKIASFLHRLRKRIPLLKNIRR